MGLRTAPELLITETLALHDIRTEDLGTDTVGMPDHTTTNPMNLDADFDQRLVPRGSLFIELFNPWTSAGNGQTKASELYYSNARRTDQRSRFGQTLRTGCRVPTVPGLAARCRKNCQRPR